MMGAARLIRLLQINLALSKQIKSSGWKLKQHFAFAPLQLDILITFYMGQAKTTTATTMNKQKSGKWGLDIDATLGVIIQFVCGSRVLTSSQLPGKGCAVETCWFNWKNRHGEGARGGEANNLIMSQQPRGILGHGSIPLGVTVCFAGEWHENQLCGSTHVWQRERPTRLWPCRGKRTEQRKSLSCGFGSHTETCNDHRAAPCWQTLRTTMTSYLLYVEIYRSCLFF